MLEGAQQEQQWAPWLPLDHYQVLNHQHRLLPPPQQPMLTHQVIHMYAQPDQHRYYGESMSYGSEDVAYKKATKMGYLIASQALADFAVLITDLKRIYQQRIHQ